MINKLVDDIEETGVNKDTQTVFNKSEEDLQKEKKQAADITKEKGINEGDQEQKVNALTDSLLEEKTKGLEEAGYLSDLDGKKISFLDVVEYDKEAIFEKLESQKLPAWVVKHLDYTTPKAEKLKIVMLRVDREKNGKLKPEDQLSESNFIAKMKEFGVRPIKFEEYLQFVSNNADYLKAKKGYIYMLEKVTSSERYGGRIQSHHNGIGIDRSQSMFYAKFPFVIEE